MGRYAKHPKHGISKADDLFVPYTEEVISSGPRGGYKPVMRFWGAGYPTWDDAKTALARGPDAFPGPTAAPVDRASGRRAPEPRGLDRGAAS